MLFTDTHTDAQQFTCFLHHVTNQASEGVPWPPTDVTKAVSYYNNRYGLLSYILPEDTLDQLLEEISGRCVIPVNAEQFSIASYSHWEDKATWKCLVTHNDGSVSFGVYTGQRNAAWFYFPDSDAANSFVERKKDAWHEEDYEELDQTGQSN